MIDFIKRNKFFSASLICCLLVIGGLFGYAIVQKIQGTFDPITLPPIFNHEDEKKDPQISLFSGEFLDDGNVIHFMWDYQLNSHNFKKLELYHNDSLIDLFENEKETELSIFDFDLSTGSNHFELRLYYDDDMSIISEADVFVDYIFDEEMKYQLVDNNLGKGYLFSIKYHYNSKTPVGIPKIFVDPTLSPSIWDASYIGKISRNLQDDYQEIEAFYMVKMNEFPDEIITWNITYTFDSVGLSFKDTISENPAQGVFNQEDIQITK